MSVEAVAWVLNQVCHVDPLEKLVLVGIANHHGDGGAWPRVSTLARYVNRSERTVQRVLARLVDIGLLVVHPQAGGTHRTATDRRPNLYVIVGLGT